MNQIAYRQNRKELSDWHAAIDQNRLPAHKGYRLTPEDQLRRDLIMTIMCSGTVSYQDFNQRYVIDFREHFAEALDQMEEPARDGLVAFSTDGFQVTEKGRLLLRNIAMPFDAYLQAGPRRHAKTI